jgi:ligand-binding sensor domain-containing protein
MSKWMIPRFPGKVILLPPDEYAMPQLQYLKTCAGMCSGPMEQHFRLFLILALAVIHSLRAQQPSFRIFTTQDGLVRNWVTKIHRDSKGYLWFCTVEGISLFDGYRFTNFSTRDGLPSRLVTDIIETSQSDYWFATAAGLARFHNIHGNGPAFRCNSRWRQQGVQRRRGPLSES